MTTPDIPLDPPPFTLVYTRGTCCVTDAQQPLEVTDTETGAPVTTVGRYGVWIAVTTHPEVIHTTNDLADAIRVCDQAAS